MKNYIHSTNDGAPRLKINKEYIFQFFHFQIRYEKYIGHVRSVFDSNVLNAVLIPDLYVGILLVDLTFTNKRGYDPFNIEILLLPN